MKKTLFIEWDVMNISLHFSTSERAFRMLFTLFWCLSFVMKCYVRVINHLLIKCKSGKVIFAINIIIFTHYKSVFGVFSYMRLVSVICNLLKKWQICINLYNMNQKSKRLWDLTNSYDLAIWKIRIVMRLCFSIYEPICCTSLC